MTASFSGLTLETTREKMLLALLKGNALYQGHHLREVASLVRLSGKAMVTGGGARIGGFLEVKKRWTGDFKYQYQDQSSLMGAAMLGQFYQKGTYT
jgi:sugar (pentulose or hexulose) kinase